MVIDYLYNNKEWLFSGIGILAITTILSIILKLFNDSGEIESGRKVTINKGNTTINNNITINKHSVQDEKHSVQDEALFLVKIRHVNDEWLQTVVEDKNNKIVYEYFKSPKQNYIPKAGDFICVYDSEYNVKFWGIINEFMYYSKDRLLSLSDEGWNIGFTNEQLDHFVKRRKESLSSKFKSEEIPVIKFEIMHRYIDPICLDKFKRENNIKLMNKPKDIGVRKIDNYDPNFLKTSNAIES